MESCFGDFLTLQIFAVKDKWAPNQKVPKYVSKNECSAFAFFRYLYKKIYIQIILHHKNKPIITKQFSSSATIDNCLTIKVYVVIYNRHNGTNLYMTAWCCHGTHTSSVVAWNVPYDNL